MSARHASPAEEPVRVFFAVDLPETVRKEVAELTEGLRRELPQAVRLPSEASWHLTLKFLGDVPRRALPKLLARATARLQSEQPFDVSLAGLGAFPNARVARVLWIGVGEGGARLAKLARKLDAAARGVGAPRERRPFHAHLTIGRLREPGHIPLERLPSPAGSGFSVEEVVLYESRLSSSGATYSPLAHLPLGADGEAIELAPEL